MPTTLERSHTVRLRPILAPVPRPAPERHREPPRDESFVDRLYRMGVEGRLSAYRAGELSHRECTIWAARFPDEVPLVNNELEWIALRAADLD